MNCIVVGEIWANTLHNVYASLVSKYGWSETARTDPTGSEGNVVFLHLLIDALALQPCNPTCMCLNLSRFVFWSLAVLNARAAWIQADANRYKSANKCLLWNVFASRGMGVNATSDYVDSFTIPSDCWVKWSRLEFTFYVLLSYLVLGRKMRLEAS